jgi:hypothetical protein
MSSYTSREIERSLCWVMETGISRAWLTTFKTMVGSFTRVE